VTAAPVQSAGGEKGSGGGETEEDIYKGNSSLLHVSDGFGHHNNHKALKQSRGSQLYLEEQMETICNVIAQIVRRQNPKFPDRLPTVEPFNNCRALRNHNG